MEDNADVFVALDGGIGTIDEVFSALSTMVFFNTRKPILILGLASYTNASRIEFHQDIGSIMSRLSTIES